MITNLLPLNSWQMRLMVRWLSHSFRLPFFGRGTKTAPHQSSDHSFFCQMLQHKCHIRSIPSSPVAFHISVAILSIPSDLASFSCFTASSTSDLHFCIVQIIYLDTRNCCLFLEIKFQNCTHLKKKG